MQNSKLVQILKTFPNKELKAFESYVNSNFFNINEQVKELLDILKTEHPNYPEEKTNSEKIFKKLFGSLKFNEQKLRYVMTDLTKLAEDFIAFSEYDKQEVHKKHFLIKSLYERNLDKYFTQQLQDGYQLQEKHPYRDSHFYENQVLLEERSYAFTSSKNNRAVDSSLQSFADNLDIHYLSKKLKFSCEIINRQNVLSVEYKLPFLDNTIEFLKKHSYEHIPAIAIYFQILLTLREGDNELHYKQLIKLLKQNINKFPLSELRDMYTFAQNYCIKQINKGNLDYLKELFENYKILLEQRIIFDGKYIAQFDFKNIVTIALRLKEYEWVADFIEKYKDNLRPESKENSVNYNLAQLHFSRKEYKQALKLLLSVEFTDIYYHLDSKALLLKTYYELEETEPLFSLTNTFKIYLKRNKQISDYQRIIYNNLIKFVKKLVKIKLGSKISLTQTKQEIESVKQVADLNWLKSKIVEME